MPIFTDKERKYFPLIHTFYEGNVSCQMCRIRKSNILSRVLYSWMSYYIDLGFKRPLVVGDLWKPSEKQRLSSDEVPRKIEKFSIQYDSKLWIGLLYCFALFASNVINTLLLNKYYEIVTNLGAEFRSILSSSRISDHLSIKSNISRFLQDPRSNNFYHYVMVHTVSNFFICCIFVLCRIKLINTVLGGIKLVKLYAWEDEFDRYISRIRVNELKNISKIRAINSVIYSFMGLSPVFISLATFYTYISLNGNIDARVAFVSMSIFSILRFPLIFLPESIRIMVAASVSYSRIRKFLSLPEIDESSEGYHVETEISDEKAIIRFFDASFSFISDNPPFLKNINFCSQSRSLHILIGANGSGKSTFLYSLLNEACIESGRLEIFGKMEYAPQQPWIRNASLRSNIIGENAFDLPKYNQVIKLCELETDINLLPAGDITEIGEKGINLSGGQKQRVGLARAIYSSASIYLFDDPFSALDKNVGRQVFHNIISSDGYLSNKIRILSTHNDEFLKFSDFIHIFKNGEILWSGKYEELLTSQIDIMDFLSPTPIDANVQDEPSLIDSKKRKIVQKNMPSNPKDIVIDKSLISKDTVQKGHVRFKIYWQYLKSMNVGIFICLILCINIFVGCNVGGQLIIAKYTSYSITKSNSTQFFIVFGGISLTQAIFSFLMNVFQVLGSYLAAKLIHQRLLRCLFRPPITFFESTPLGRLLNAFSKEMSVIDESIANSLRITIFLFISLLFSMLTVTFILPYILIGIVILFIIFYFVQNRYMKSSRQIQRLESLSRSPIISLLVDTFYGLSIIKCSRYQKIFSDRFDNMLDNNLVPFKMNMYCNRWLGARLEMISNFLVAFCSISIVIVIKTIGISAGYVGYILNITTSITQTMSFFIRNRCTLENEIVSIERISSFFDIECEKEYLNFLNIPSNWPNEGSISFIDYSCCYRNHLPNVLNSLNFSIKSKEKIGIVGRTGSGKSSLLLSIFRMVERTQGRIEIDTIDIFKIRLQTLRKALTIIPQVETFLFNGTLRENIDPSQTYTDEEIIKSLKLSQLDNFLSSRPEGLDHQIVESGANISSGEKQLICLARALLKHTKILVLDEATSNVDLKTDKLIQAIIRKEFSDCTVITVAHRIETIIDYDRIIVMDAGSIAEFDSPQNLLARHDSLFYQLVSKTEIPT
ncbi:LOW QUALITY PROTEIN: hypothetical protein MXB_2975 [Myxobolus squamalis]|nr:LOW QUALITY PROTEIN: hypothetical protein MXB_2975 [Myxobolus squamalis]